MNYANDAALGISSTETTRNAKANELYGKSFKDLDEAQKQLTLLTQVEDANKLSGAFQQASREGGQFENVTGNLAQAWENFKVAIGGNFLDLAIGGVVGLTNAIQSIDTAAISAALQVIVGTITNIAQATIPLLIQAFEFVKTAISTAIDFVLPIIDNLRESWQTNSQEISDTVSSVFSAIRDTITSVVEAVLSFVRPQLEKLTQFWDENGKQILDAVRNAFNGILAVIEFVMPAVRLIIQIAWGAIQDIISGALNVIMGLIKVFSGIFTGDFSKLWEGIKQIFFGAIDLIIGIMTLSFFGGIRTIITNLAKSAISIVRGLWDDILRVFRSFIDDTVSAVGGFVSRIVESFRQLVLKVLQFILDWRRDSFKVLDDIVEGMVQKFIALPGQFVQIGKDIIQGLINGLKALNPVKIIGDIASNIIDGAKSIFKINSPSKVFTEIGGFVSEGLEVGISKGAPGAVKAVNDLAKETVKAAQKKIQDEYNLEVDAIKSNQELTEQKRAQDLKALDEKRDIDKQLIDIITDTVKQRKQLGAISIAEEAAIWQETLSTFEVGTNGYAQAQIKYRDTLTEINETVVKTNETFQKRITEINNNLLKQEQDLTTQYEKAYNDRYNSLINFSGLFEEFGVKTDITGEGLVRNLETQVSGFVEWQGQIDRLSKKAIDDGLLYELRKAGPNALAELRALNSLTDEQLTRYSALFQVKSKVAREQTEKELYQLQVHTGTQIAQLRSIALVELDQLEVEWLKDIEKITKGTEQGFSSMEDIGRNAAQNLYNGIASVESSLISKATSIAASVQAAFANALNVPGINGPSFGGLTAPSSVQSSASSSGASASSNKTQINNITVQSTNEATAMQREVRKLNFGF